MRPRVQILIVAGAVFGLSMAGGCSSKSTTKNIACQSGDTAVCDGADGCVGSRECVDGNWSPCECSAASGMGGSGGSSPSTAAASTTIGGEAGGSGAETASSTGGASSSDSGGSGGSSTTDSSTSDAGGSGGTTNTTTSTSDAGGNGGGTSTTTTGDTSSGGTGGATSTTTGESTTGEVDDGSGPVTGRVLNNWLQPVPNVTVMIGTEEVVTDDDGEFQFADVPAEYTVMLDVRYDYFEEARFGWVFEGLTRRDPTLQVYAALPLRYAQLSVEPQNIPAGTNMYMATALGGQYGSFIAWDTDTDADLYWYGPATTTMSSYGLLWEHSNGIPTNYLSFTEGSTVLLEHDPGGNTPVPVALDMTPGTVTMNTVTGSVQSPTYNNRRNAAYVRFPSNAVIQLLGEEVDDTPNFSYNVPSVANGSIIVAAHEGWRFAEAKAVAYQTAVGTAQPITLSIPSPAVPNGPANNSVLASDTVFSWGGDAAVYTWSLYADNYYAGYFIVTTRKQVNVPVFPNGLDVLQPGQPYYWRVETHGSPASVDEMAGEYGYIGDFNRMAYLNPASPRSISSTYTSTAQTWIDTPE